MAYIRFNLTRITDDEGRTTYARINRMESDMPTLATLEPGIIWNALSHKGSVVKWFCLDTGALDRDLLREPEPFRLDTGYTDFDFLT